jgi:Cyclin, N-terminal domain
VLLQLMPETLFLTTNLIDRFLEIKGVTRKNLQLVSHCAICVGPPTLFFGSNQMRIWDVV